MRRILLTFIRVYKIFLSPLLPASCRFFPSCSDYAAQVVAKHGALKGGWIAIRRLLRCRPFGGSGFDPIPLCACDKETAYE